MVVQEKHEIYHGQKWRTKTRGKKETQQQSPKTCQGGEQLSQLELLGRASLQNLGLVPVGHPDWSLGRSNQWLVGYLF